MEDKLLHQINEAGVKIKSRQVFQSAGEYPTQELAGVFLNGVQFYDFSSVRYISNAELAKLIGVIKSLVKIGMEVKLVNPNEEIKNKIKSMGMEIILIKA